MMGASLRFLEITASIQSQGLALSEWADAQPEPWEMVLRFLPISGAFFLGLLLVVFWKRRPFVVVSVEQEEKVPPPVVPPKSDAEEKLVLVQNELKLTLEKNKRQKERIASAKRALEVKDQEVAKLRLDISSAEEANLTAVAVEPESDKAPPSVIMEPREDLQELAAASEELAQVEVDFRKNLKTEKPIAEDKGKAPADWDELLLFRSKDPAIWNQSVNEGENHRAILLSEVPDNMTYLRLRRLDTGEGVVMAVDAAGLKQEGGDLMIGFNGSNEEFYGARHLGIYSEDLPQQVEIRFAYGGWGFGHCPNNETAQACAWAGQEINSETVIEITVYSRFPGLTDNDQLIEPS